MTSAPGVLVLAATPIGDPRDAAPRLAEEIATAIAALGIVGYLGTPVVVDGVVLGVLAAYSYERRPWSPEDVALIVDLALVAANEVELGRLRRVARPPPSVRGPAPTPAAADGDAVVYDRRRFRVEAQERMVTARRAGTGLTLHLVRVAQSETNSVCSHIYQVFQPVSQNTLLTSDV